MVVYFSFKSNIKTHFLGRLELQPPIPEFYYIRGFSNLKSKLGRAIGLYEPCPLLPHVMCNILISWFHYINLFCSSLCLLNVHHRVWVNNSRIISDGRCYDRYCERSVFVTHKFITNCSYAIR